MSFLTVNLSHSKMEKNKEQLRICIAASAGGHISQLLKLSQCWYGHKTFCVTTTKVVEDQISKYGSVYIVGECNYQHPLRVLATLTRCFKVVIRERPDIVISTGATAGCIMCFLGKFFGAKVVWIDSITNVNRISLSGRLVRPIADLFLVQWPHLVQKHGNIEFAGTVI
jgi:UDP-N-acetylglucosamine:LPS N-acetylglucosamine transferase